MAIIVTNDDRKYQTPSMGRAVAAGTIAGGAASAAILVANKKVGDLVGDKLSKMSQANDANTLKQGIEDSFRKSGLAEKGVTFFNVNEKTKIDSVFDTIPAPIRNLISPIEAIKKGKNASYVFDTKQILVNVDKFGVSAFHEMGHAVNHNFSKFWSGMQGLRMPMQSLSGLLMLTALLKRKKVEGEEPKNGFDKATTFIKNNVGKLVALTFVPIVAEELKASHNGNKMAEKVLNKDMLKKVKNFNKVGAITYISAAVLSGLAAVGLSKIRDVLTKPKEIID